MEYFREDQNFSSEYTVPNYLPENEVRIGQKDPSAGIPQTGYDSSRQQQQLLQQQKVRNLKLDQRSTQLQMPACCKPVQIVRPFMKVPQPSPKQRPLTKHSQLSYSQTPGIGGYQNTPISTSASHIKNACSCGPMQNIPRTSQYSRPKTSPGHKNEYGQEIQMRPERMVGRQQIQRQTSMQQHWDKRVSAGHSPYQYSEDSSMPMSDWQGGRFIQKAAQSSQRKKQQQKGLQDFEEVERLLQEEETDLDLTKRLQSVGLNQSVESDEQYSPEEWDTFCDEEEDYCDHREISSDVAAAMMHTEEQGIAMRSAPSHVYNTLFRDDIDLVPIASAGPTPMEDVVIPITSRWVPYSDSADNMPAVTSVTYDRRPQDSAFTENLEKRGLYDQVLKQATSIEIAKQLKLDTFNDQYGMVDSKSGISLSPQAGVGKLEYMLEAEPPTRFSLIQLRGSNPPRWFPGFYQALPHISGLTSVTTSPMDALGAAWKAVKESFHSEEM